MRSMKNSDIKWIGEIPTNWQLAPTKRFFRNNKRIAKDRASQYERLALTLTGVIKRNKNDTEGLQPEKFENYQIVNKNDLVFKLIDLENVKTSRVGLSSYTGLVSPAYIVLTNNNSDNRFFYYWFAYMYYAEVFNHLGDAGVRSSLSASDVLNLPIPTVSLQEQQKIADYLDAKCQNINSSIIKEKEIIDKLEEYKLSCITAAVTKGLDPTVPMKDSGMDWVGMIPQHWKICRLRNIGTVQNGISKSGDYFGHGSPFIAYGDVYKNFSIPKQVMGRLDSTPKEQTLYSVQTGDIFFTRTSETIDEIGFSAVCEETIPHATFAGFLIRVRPFNHYLTTNFAKYYFRSNHQRYYFTKQMNLVTRASLSQDLLKSMPILLPPHNEQKEIAAYLDKKFNSIQNAITQKQEIIDKLTEYKKSLIYEVVTGKKEV